jgi:hypothetical protein
MREMVLRMYCLIILEINTIGLLCKCKAMKPTAQLTEHVKK